MWKGRQGRKCGKEKWEGEMGRRNGKGVKKRRERIRRTGEGNKKLEYNVTQWENCSPGMGGMVLVWKRNSPSSGWSLSFAALSSFLALYQVPNSPHCWKIMRQACEHVNHVTGM